MKEPLPGKIFLLLLIYSSSFTLLFSQNAVLSYGDICRSLHKGEQISFSEISSIDPGELETFLKNFSFFFTENDGAGVKLNSYRFLYLAGLKHREFSRQVVSDLVLYGMGDEDLGNRKSVCEFLDSYPADSFNAATRNKVASYAMQEPSPFKEIILLSARLDLTELVPHFQQLLLQGDLNQSQIWTLNIALGRLGESSSAIWCLERVKEMGMNDLVIFKLLPDLIFMHDKPSIDFLLETILSDETKCSSPNPDSDVKINCAYRIMELVAPVIVDFPLEVDEGGELETDDYRGALELVRNWIRQTGLDYELR